MDWSTGQTLLIGARTSRSAFMAHERTWRSALRPTRHALSAVAWSQVEGAVLQRVDLAHHDLGVGEAVVLFRRPRDGAVDARPALGLVPVGDDVVGLRTGGLERLAHHLGAVPA